MIFCPDGGKEVLQLLLPAALKQETLCQLHQEHSHEGIDRTTELVRQWCFWLGMSGDINDWVQKGERCQVAKDSGEVPHSYMGHLLNFFVHTDIFIKFTVAVPTRDQWASTVARFLVFEWVY